MNNRMRGASLKCGGKTSHWLSQGGPGEPAFFESR